jgi:hypothetical protein
MVAVLTLAEAKAHLQIAGNGEDEAISVLIDAAGDYLGRIGCPVDANPLAPALKAAALIAVQQLYATRPQLELTRETVEGVGSQTFDHSAADRILSTTLDRLVASVREVTL